jgi:hypothetical protein
MIRKEILLKSAPNAFGINCATEVKLKNKCRVKKYLIIKIKIPKEQTGVYNYANTNTINERFDANQMEQASINY